MREFSGRVAVITGGASGIGLGIARALAARGMQLLVADLDENAMAAARDELELGGATVATFRCNVARLDEVQALADFAMAQYGAVHVLCNNAGIGIPTSTRNMRLEDWKWTLDVDLWGPIHGVHVFLPLIEAQEEGHIMSTASMAGLIANSVMGAYNVAKHGVVALMASLERELRARDSTVRTSVLCPGPINTDISHHSESYRPGQRAPGAEAEREAQATREIEQNLSQGKHPDDVGELVAAAMAERRFWVLTHPTWIKSVRRQLDALIEDGSLTQV